ncbi:MAG: hypothetical protein ABIK44_04405 [candidate division WOR-3 bacterium]
MAAKSIATSVAISVWEMPAAFTTFVQTLWSALSQAHSQLLGMTHPEVLSLGFWNGP